MAEELDVLIAATRKYHRAKRNFDAAKQEVVDAMLTALRAGASPGDVAEGSPFTPAYVRRIAKEAGIPPAPPGPKARKK
jgi:hypothetical protein